MPKSSLALVFVLLLACDDKSGTDTSDATDTSDVAGDTRDTTGDTRDADTGPTPTAPTLTSVKANVHGPQGLNLRLTLIGSDVDKDIDRVKVRLFSAQGDPVLAFRSGLSDTPDSNETVLAFDDPAAVKNKKDILATVTLRNLFATVEPAKVEVLLIDLTSLESAVTNADVTPQAVVALGGPCDETYTESRCEAGLGCRDGQCKEGLAPEITKVAYLNGQGGTRIVAVGTEPEDDIDSLLIEFLDLQGNPITIDLDNDEVPESDSFRLDAQGRAADGKFSVRLDPSEEFESQVKQIAVTPRDLADHEGARKTAKLTASPVRSTGQGCDPLGFDVCSATSVCVQGATGTTFTCRDVNAQRKAECAAAPVLPLDGTPVIGFASGASLFDAPAGCSSGDPKGRPEAVVKLVLDSPAARLTLTTDLPETTFDTVLYLVPACGETSAAPLGCADESASSAAATLELELVPAGSYLVVIDSWGPGGGQFALSAQVE